MKLVVHGVSKAGWWQRIAAKEVLVLLNTRRKCGKIYHPSSAFSQFVRSVASVAYSHVNN
jgi:hypothetical protein